MDSFPINRFGGFNLVSDPEEVGPERAIEAKNVVFDAEGRVRSRPGFSSYSTMGAGEWPERIFPWPRAGTSNYLASSGARLEAYAAGSSVASVATSVSAAFAHDFAAFGDPTAEYVYVVGRGDSTRRWDGSVFTVPAAMPSSAMCVTVQPLDNRLVIAGFATDASRVDFSNAGVPETFVAANRVQLTPGDGEQVVALSTFNNMLFAFKQTKFFVFTGNSVGAAGAPIFNYRIVDTGIGCSDYWPGAVATGLDGVYFRGRDGIYRTTGGPPELVSGAIEPVFKAQFQSTSTLFSDGSVPIPVESTGNGHTELRFISKRHMVISTLSVSGSTGVTLLWDRATDSWGYWDTHTSGTVTAICEPLPGDINIAMLFSKGTSSIYQMRPLDTTDSGVAIASHYQSGLYKPVPGRITTTRRSILWGSGSPTFNIFNDHATSDPLTRGGAVALGIAPAVAKGYHNKSYRGDYFSHKISSTGKAWSLNSLEHDIASASRFE